MKGDRIAKAQGIPPNFLENILGDLRNAGIVASRDAVRTAATGSARPPARSASQT